MKRKLYKYGGIALATLLAIGIIGNMTGYEPEKEVVQAEKDAEPTVAEPQEVAEQPELAPLSKSEILAKFPLADGEPTYENGRFEFIGDRSDTADYYILAPSDTFEDASIIFKDGELAAVKLWLNEGDDVGKAFEAFGIADAAEQARRANEFTHVYEYAVIPLYWSQNIEKYPFEMD